MLLSYVYHFKGEGASSLCVLFVVFQCSHEDKITQAPSASHLTPNIYHGLKRLLPDLSSAWVSSGYSGFLPQLSGKRLKDYETEYG